MQDKGGLPLRASRIARKCWSRTGLELLWLVLGQTGLHRELGFGRLSVFFSSVVRPIGLSARITLIWVRAFVPWPVYRTKVSFELSRTVVPVYGGETSEAV
jgi:hypothetical protein